MTQIVKYKKGKLSFEILVKPDTVRPFLAGKLGLDNVLGAEVVFTNSKKGNLARNKDLVEAFGTDDVRKCAEIMIRNGTSQVSASERKEDTEKHKNQILEYLHKNFLDQNNLPHPLARLESFLKESKVRIDPSIHPCKQADEVIKKMTGKAVFRKATKTYILTVKKEVVKPCRDIVRRYCQGVKEIREPDSTTWRVEILSSEFDTFLADMNKVTEGDFQVKEES